VFNEAVGALSATLRSRGGVIVAASGNTFDLNRLGSPACVSSVLAVGGVNAGDQVLSYSNTAPTLDLLAPGDRILTTGIYGGQVLLSGTSAAAPHVAGAAALLLSANPGLSADALEERLESHGVPVVDSRTGRTTPRVDALRALLLPARIELLPPVVSFASRGRYLLVRIEPDPPYRAVDLDPDSFTLRLGDGDSLEGTGGAPELGDADGNGITDLTLRFARRDLLGSLGPGIWPVRVEGSLKSGIAVGGSSSLRLTGREPKGPAREPVP
jgi:subtilisin family serine protease